jgi:hypothetical protein
LVLRSPSAAARILAFLGVLLLVVAFCLYSAHSSLAAVAENKTERSDLVPLLKIARDWSVLPHWQLPPFRVHILQFHVLACRAVSTLLFSALSAQWGASVRSIISAETWLGSFATAQGGGANQL